MERITGQSGRERGGGVYSVPTLIDFRPRELSFCVLALKHAFFPVRLGELPRLLRCNGEAALRQPPQPAAESEGAGPGDQSSNGGAGNRPLSPGHQSTGGRIGKYLFLSV